MESNIYNIIINKLNGNNLSEQDNNALTNWLLDDDNKQIFSDLSTIWEADKTVYKTDVDVDKEWVKFKKNKQQVQTKSLYYTISGIAATVIILLGLFVLMPTKTITYKYSEAHNHFILPDSSEVWLNNNSHITFSKKFDKDNRNVNLIGAEAFFKVKKGKNPFIVNTPLGVTAKVLGTSFNIVNKKNKVELQVFSGLVEFGKANENNTVKIAKGKKANYLNIQNKITTTEIKDLNKVAWATGEFVFNNDNLQDVVNLLESYLSVKIIIPQSFYNKKFSGKFSQPTIQEFSMVITKVFNLKANTSNNKIEFKEK